jgi:hypothetical protein
VREIRPRQDLDAGDASALWVPVGGFDEHGLEERGVICTGGSNGRHES